MRRATFVRIAACITCSRYKLNDILIEYAWNNVIPVSFVVRNDGSDRFGRRKLHFFIDFSRSAVQSASETLTIKKPLMRYNGDAQDQHCTEDENGLNLSILLLWLGEEGL
jgi:hypothetical protein